MTVVSGEKRAVEGGGGGGREGEFRGPILGGGEDMAAFVDMARSSRQCEVQERVGWWLVAPQTQTQRHPAASENKGVKETVLRVLRLHGSPLTAPETRMGRAVHCARRHARCHALNEQKVTDKDVCVDGGPPSLMCKGPSAG